MLSALDKYLSTDDGQTWDAEKAERVRAEAVAELAALRAKAALADDLYRIWRGHEHACRSTMYLEHWMGRYEAIK